MEFNLLFLFYSLNHSDYKINKPNILTVLKNATLALTFLYIFQNTVVCEIPLLRRCHHELASSVNTLVLIVQLNSTILFAPHESSH